MEVVELKEGPYVLADAFISLCTKCHSSAVRV